MLCGSGKVSFCWRCQLDEWKGGNSALRIYGFTERVAAFDIEEKALVAQLQEQEEEACNVIIQWQESSSVLEEKCVQLEKHLELMKEEKGSIEKTLEAIEEEKSSLVEQVTSLEDTVQSQQSSGKDEELVSELQELREKEYELKETISRDEEAVHQWEGMYQSPQHRKQNRNELTFFILIFLCFVCFQ
jgi:chromosome segregation ATPase